MPDDAGRFVRAHAALVAAGCVAADEEAAELIAVADGDDRLLDDLLARRGNGEPLAWLSGSVTFCGIQIAVDRDIYVPRWQSELLALRACEHLPDDGVAVDLGTGSGAIAAVLRDRHPHARVIGTEPDARAARCATSNGVEVVSGPLFVGVPTELAGHVDVVVGVLPYVPRSAMAFLPRDVLTYEPRTAIDGGNDGLAVVVPAIKESARWLRRGGWLGLEVGGDQPGSLESTFAAAGFAALRVINDADGDVRGVEAVAVLRHLAR